MSAAIVLVKNMVCHRCVLVVEDILRSRSIPFQKVVIGEINLAESFSANQRDELMTAFVKVSFELIDSHTGALIEKIKQVV